MPIEFTVIGEHKDDEGQLLVVGADGKYYGYVPSREPISLSELDEHWLIYGRDHNEMGTYMDGTEAIEFQP